MTVETILPKRYYEELVKFSKSLPPGLWPVIVGAAHEGFEVGWKACAANLAPVHREEKPFPGTVTPENIVDEVAVMCNVSLPRDDKEIAIAIIKEFGRQMFREGAEYERLTRLNRPE